MSAKKKRSYNSENRKAQAVQTKKRILSAAKKLFQSEGYECVTIEQIANEAGVSPPTIYSVLQSKRGVLLALLDDAFPAERYQSLIDLLEVEPSRERSLAIGAKVARQMYDAEKDLMDMLRGASVLAPEFKELEKEQEKRRYERQKASVESMVEEGSLKEGLSLKEARDILWAFTGRDLYRLYVIERGWTSDRYEQWLAELLATSLLR